MQAALDREVMVMSYETGLSVEEKVTSLFQPDTLIPAQYFETFRRKAHLEPERRLMLAVLEDAVACFQKYVSARDSKGKGTFRDAEEWILEEERDWLFSFNNICEVLGFDPQYVRKGLMRWKETRLAERPKAKVYRLTPKRRRRKSRETDPSRSGQKWLKAVGR
ncbi:MAG: hypothetical protein A2038_02255 [Deltaproteobacteria bacterium GWA2_57_13]|nr:MAG: hypothetical protein A2038_02255 [Deltaproteobacteria bacterium GWA2_57_13]OGQ49208.1 MAG: hypothetical protein A3I10_08645 [Deltaproteobacteria bacterium RIFCSPLOWO2_02_FULL_57_26]OGQ75497.1 MAG: hypothetical protein A3G40_13195 [Deltaproteobacteria bacterium RIFCSPLOWO2_12_FULL_57_22]